METNFTGADLTGSYIYGISAWRLTLSGTKQQNLVITLKGEPEITVDNIEVAQFIYLLLHNRKIRDVIDTVGKKAVLILGRFTTERKAVLDDLREELRKRDYVPILFDFDKPPNQDLTATVATLAHLARFIIADLSDPGTERILAFLGRGAIVGELAVLDGLPRSTSVVAVRDAAVSFLSKAAFEAFAANHPELHESMLRLLAKLVRDRDKMVAATSFLSLNARIAQTLLELADHFGQEVGQGRIVIRQSIRQRDLAAMAGIARENVTRILNE